MCVIHLSIWLVGWVLFLFLLFFCCFSCHRKLLSKGLHRQWIEYNTRQLSRIYPKVRQDPHLSPFLHLISSELSRFSLRVLALTPPTTSPLLHGVSAARSWP